MLESTEEVMQTLLQKISALSVPTSRLLTADSTAAGPAARAKHSVARSCAF